MNGPWGQNHKCFARGCANHVEGYRTQTLRAIYTYGGYKPSQVSSPNHSPKHCHNHHLPMPSGRQENSAKYERTLSGIKDFSCLPTPSSLSSFVLIALGIHGSYGDPWEPWEVLGSHLRKHGGSWNCAHHQDNEPSTNEDGQVSTP